MQDHKVMAIDFNHSNPGVVFESEQDFKDWCFEGLEALVKHRFEHAQEAVQEVTAKDLQPLPTMINLYFEDGSYASTLLFPESDLDKQYLMTGVKKMMAKYDQTKKIKAACLIIEAWLANIDTKEIRKTNKFADEMSDEQLQRRINREWKENKIPKMTRIIMEYQTPVKEADKQTTAIVTSIYKLLEHKLLVLDEDLTTKMNEPGIGGRRNPWFCLFTDLVPEEQSTQRDVTNFNILTAVEYLKRFNKLMK